MQLHAENEIKKLVIGFSLAMDARDYQLFRASWADEIELELPPVGGDAVPLAGRQRADDYARGVIALLSQFKATQHVSTNHLVSLDGTGASCTCYTLAQHYLPVETGEAWLTVGARYDLTAQLLDELGWRFVRFKLTHLWSRGNNGLWSEATRRLKGDQSR